MKAEVRLHNGTPTLFLNGEPAFAGYLWATAPTTTDYPVADVVRAYADAGIPPARLRRGLGRADASVVRAGAGPLGTLRLLHR